MSSFFIDLWESIFTPGPTPTILLAANITFAALQLLFLLLLLATRSIHFVVLSALSACLWRAINWFAGELAAAQEQERRQQQRQQREEEKEDSDTEVERSRVLDGVEEAADVQPVERLGDMRLRVVERPTSSASTEDEWERVSENEDAKGQ